MNKELFLNPRFIDQVIEEQDLLVFFHAQRTAGSAFRHILADAFGKDKVFCTQYAGEFKHWELITEEELQEQRVFAGHSNFEEKGWARKLHYTSILRHPVYRTFSLYYYCQKYPNQFLHDFAKDKSIEDFYYAASEKKPKYFNNVLCRRIAGVTDFQSAKKSIEDRFFLIGATESFSKFVQQFLASQNLPAQDVPKAKRDVERYGELLEKTTLVKDILSNNKEDEKLFRYFNREYFGFDEQEYPWS